VTARKAAPLVLLLLAMGCAHWSTADTMRQAAIVGLQVMDWHQSRTIATEMVPESYTERPDGSSEHVYARPRWRESSPFLPSHPSAGQVDAYFAASILTGILISAVLPAEWRPYWQYGYIGFEGAFVVHNYQQGIR